MYCVRCGTKNPEDARFCKSCGRVVEEDAPSASPAEPSNGEDPAAHEEPPAADAPAERAPADRARTLLKLAHEHYTVGDVAGALNCAEEAAHINGDDAEVHLLLSTLYERQGDVDRAIREREVVLQLVPDSLPDREKLESLKAGVVQKSKPAITSAHELDPRLLDTPAGAAAAALGVTLLVTLLGAAIVWMRNGNEHKVTAQKPPAASQAGGASNMKPLGGAGPTPMPPQENTTAATPFQQMQQQPPAQPGNSQPMQPAPNTTGLDPARPISPAPVNPGVGAPLENSEPRGSTRRSDDAGTIYLPQGGNQGAPASRSAEGGSGQPTPRTDPGRIQIVVAPGGDAPSHSPTGATTTSMSSQSQKQIGLEAQRRGDHRAAAAAYEKALAGAGDDGPSLEQKLALCYQVLGDKQKAADHYTRAIQGYKALQAAGKAQDAASAIRSCEAGLKLNQ